MKHLITKGSLFAVIAIAFSFSFGNAHAAACNEYDKFVRVPAGFGASYDVTTSAMNLVLHTTCVADGALFTVGNGGNTEYVYKYGYEYYDNKWQRIEFDGDTAVGSWFRGDASTKLTRTSDELEGHNYVLAYTCKWHGGKWKCGCRDRACDKSYWQMQSFTYEVPDDGSVGLDEKFTVMPGEGVIVDDALKLEFIEVTEDSRCPSDVQCFWEGTIGVALELSANGVTETVKFRAKDGPFAFEGYAIDVLDATPYPETNIKIDPSKYKVTFVVKEDDGTTMRRVTIGEKFVMTPGERVAAEEYVITFDEVDHDSRCPINALCVTAGTIGVVLQLATGDTIEVADFEKDDGPFEFGAYEIEIVNEEPSTLAGETIEQDEYKITFVMRDNSGQ